MSRITEKCKDGGYQLKAGNEIYGEENGIRLVQIVGQVEDLKETLGISLFKLFVALENGIYGKVGNKIEHILAPHLSWHNREIYIFKIKDYGKTWALTKEELTNGK